MILLAGSTLLGLAVCVYTLLLARGYTKAGWWFALALQLVYVPYDVITNQYGFLIITGVMVTVAIHELRKTYVRVSSWAPDLCAGDMPEVGSSGQVHWVATLDQEAEAAERRYREQDLPLAR